MHSRLNALAGRYGHVKIVLHTSLACMWLLQPVDQDPSAWHGQWGATEGAGRPTFAPLGALAALLLLKKLEALRTLVAGVIIP